MKNIFIEENIALNYFKKKIPQNKLILDFFAGKSLAN